MVEVSLPRVIIDLLDQEILLCPKNNLPLKLHGDGVSSGGHEWKAKNRSLDLYGEYTSDAPEFTDHGFVRDVASALGFAEHNIPSVTLAVADTALVSGDSSFTAEIGELADRLGIIGREQLIYVEPEPDNLTASLSFCTPYIGPTMPVGAVLKRSIRVENLGNAPVSSHGETPAYISYHWLDAAGETFEHDGLRSSFPIALMPGSAVTIICDIATPKIPGSYILQIQPVIEGVRWLEETVCNVPVLIEEWSETNDQFEYTSFDHSYAEDHSISLGMAAEMLGDKLGEKRVLEVGGGIHPQSSALTQSNCNVVSIDISSPMCQLGQLYFDHVAGNDRIGFITCDAHHPPFKDGTFDGVLIFSALHHFSDPVKLLTNLRRIVKPGGFVAAMCEPCLPNASDPMYLRDLQKGINEQIWSIEEYQEIFRRAGLRLLKGRVDGGSMKAILVPA